MNTRVLVDREEAAAREDVRQFAIEFRGRKFGVAVRLYEEEVYAGALPEEPRAPYHFEVLELFEYLLDLAREPDVEAGWEEYRRALLEAQGVRVPGWEDLPGDVRTAFAVGVDLASGGGRQVERRGEVLERLDQLADEVRDLRAEKRAEMDPAAAVKATEAARVSRMEPLCGEREPGKVVKQFVEEIRGAVWGRWPGTVSLSEELEREKLEMQKERIKERNRLRMKLGGGSVRSGKTGLYQAARKMMGDLGQRYRGESNAVLAEREGGGDA